MIVRPVTSRRDLQAWIDLPRRSVYGEGDPWVSQLDADLRRLVDQARNPYFRHAEGSVLLATDARGRALGRLLAHVDRDYQEHHGERAAFFGLFESTDDPAVAVGLIRAAAAFGEARGCTVLRGPFNLTAAEQIGILVDGFDQAPALDTTYTAPHYPALLEAAGLEAVFPHATYRVDDLSAEPSGPPSGTPRVPSGIRIRYPDLSDWDAEVERLRRLLNMCLGANEHFVPISGADFAFQIGPLRRVMDPAICPVAEVGGEPAGFIIAVPDLNPILRPFRGRFGPLQILDLLRRRSQIRDATAIVIGVRPDLQGRGVMTAVQTELRAALRRRGYRRLTTTWVADANAASVAVARRMGGRVVHRLALYEATLPMLDP